MADNFPPGHIPLSTEKYAELNIDQKLALVTAYHRGMREAAEDTIVQQATAALSAPKAYPPPETPEEAEAEAARLAAEGPRPPLPPPTPEEIVVVLLHVEDPFVVHLPGLAAHWKSQGIEVGVLTFVSEYFAKGLARWRDPVTGVAAYLPAAQLIAQRPPPGCMYIATFAMGKCDVVVSGMQAVDDSPGSEVRASDELGPPGDGIPELDDGTDDVAEEQYIHEVGESGDDAPDADQ